MTQSPANYRRVDDQDVSAGSQAVINLAEHLTCLLSCRAESHGKPWDGLKSRPCRCDMRDHGRMVYRRCLNASWYMYLGREPRGEMQKENDGDIDSQTTGARTASARAGRGDLSPDWDAERGEAGNSDLARSRRRSRVGERGCGGGFLLHPTLCVCVGSQVVVVGCESLADRLVRGRERVVDPRRPDHWIGQEAPGSSSTRMVQLGLPQDVQHRVASP